MEESRLKIARKKKGLTQKAAANILGITPQAWNSAELGKTKMHRNNLEIVAREFDVSFSWLVTGEGNDTMAMPEDIGAGMFVRIRSGQELLTGKRDGESRYVFIPRLDEDAIAYHTISELPAGVTESILIAVASNLTDLFINGKWYLMAIDGILIVRKIEKVVFGTNKGSFKLTSLEGAVDFLKGKGIGLWRVIYRLDRLS
jgi:transcriptional regulator with XRE-family HTH domain